jgi:hypothetical protein
LDERLGNCFITSTKLSLNIIKITFGYLFDDF